MSSSGWVKVGGSGYRENTLISSRHHTENSVCGSQYVVLEVAASASLQELTGNANYRLHS